MPRNESELEDVHTGVLVNELCERMHLKPAEAERFKDNIMTRCGYKRQIEWVDSPAGDDASGFFDD